MVTAVSAVDSAANNYAAQVTEIEETRRKKVTQPLDFKAENDTTKTSKTASQKEVEEVEKAEQEYQEDKKNILQKFADKMKKIFSDAKDGSLTVGAGVLGGGILGGLLGILKGGLRGLLKGGAIGALIGLGLIGIGALIGKLFGKDDEVKPEDQEKPTKPSKPEPRVYEVKKGDNIWNIAKADLIEKHKDDPDYKVTNKEILERTNEIMEINKTVSDKDKKDGFVELKWEKDHYHVLIKEGDKIKLDPEEVEEEKVKELAVA